MLFAPPAHIEHEKRGSVTEPVQLPDGPPLRRKRNVGCHKLVCANVYGLCWSESLLARMECAALFSPLVIQSLETSSGYGFKERRVQPLCHLLIRQQTW